MEEQKESKKWRPRNWNRGQGRGRGYRSQGERNLPSWQNTRQRGFGGATNHQAQNRVSGTYRGRGWRNSGYSMYGDTHIHESNGQLMSNPHYPEDPHGPCPNGDTGHLNEKDNELLRTIGGSNVRKVDDILSAHLEGPTLTQKGLDCGLIEACKLGEKFMVQMLVKAGSRIHATDEKKNTPLMIASEYRFTDIARFLLKKGADNPSILNFSNSEGDTALILSIRSCGSSDMISLLLSCNAAHHIQNKKGMTAMMKAVEARDLDAVKILVDKGATMDRIKNHNHETAMGMATRLGLGHVLNLLTKAEKVGKNRRTARMTPLMKAVAELNVDAVRLILDCQFSNVNKRAQDGTALMHIVRSLSKEDKPKNNKVKLEILKLLLDNGARVEDFQSKDGTPLIVATMAGKPGLVRLLSQHSSNLNSMFSNKTALMIAAENGSIDLLNILLDAGADVNISNHVEETALLAALKHGQVECAKVLLDKSAKIDCLKAAEEVVASQQVDSLHFLAHRYDIDVNKHFLLCKALKNGNHDMAKILIDMKADVNFPNEHGVLPLMFACCKGEALVKLLIENGADVNKSSASSCLPIIKSISCPVEILQLLIEKGADVNKSNEIGDTALILACQRYTDNLEYVTSLVEAGANVNLQNEKGETALHHAASTENMKNIKKLVESKADLELKNSSGETAYLIAAETGNIDIIRFLQESGADVDAEDETGSTALLHAVKHCDLKNLSTQTIELLAKNPQHMNKQNHQGFTPLMLAAEECSHLVISTLIKLGADVNIVNTVESKYNNTTALSVLLENITSFNKKYEMRCMEEFISHGAVESLPERCRSVLHRMIVLDRRHAVQKLIISGMSPCTVDLRPAMYRLGPFFQMQMLRFTMAEASPLSAALASGNLEIARYLTGNWFLTQSDLFGLAKKNSLREYLATMDMTECVEFVDQFSSQPKSLLQLSFIATSTALGSSPGRHARVRQTPLPAMVQDKLLFKTEEVKMDFSGTLGSNGDCDGSDDDDLDSDDDDDDDGDPHGIFLDYDEASQFFYDSGSDKYLYYDDDGLYDSDNDTFICL